MSAKHRNGVPGIELGEQLLGADNEPSQSVRREDNLAMASGRHEKNMPVTKFKLGRLFSKIASVVHPLISLPRYAEQANDNEPTFGSVNSLTNSISVPFLPSASFARRAA